MPASVGLLVQVDAGMTGVMCGRRADGSVVAWGYSGFGEADVPEDLPPAIHVETGFRATMALLEDGTIRCWGDPNGNCAIPPGLDDVVAFSASYHTAAVRSDGSVVCWGRNTDGQCNVPAGVDSVVAVSAGEVHTLAVSSMASGGRVTAWGKNDYGQCSVPSDLEGVVSVSAGRKHSVALKADGKVRCWGTNLYGSFNAELHPEPIKQIGVLDYATVLLEADDEIVRRHARLFLPDEHGARPSMSGHPLFTRDPTFRELVHFHEYFDGDTGRGCGASHQTGWTACIAKMLTPRTAHGSERLA
jgi:hypothetical protein